MLLKKPGQKLYIIVSIIALVVIGGYVFYRIKKHDFLDHQLQKIVKDKTDQIYNLSYDSIYVDEVGGDLYVRNIYIKGDTARQMQLINNKDTNATSVIFDIYIPTLKVVDFKTAKALLSKQLECRQIIISDPQVSVYLFPGQGTETDNKKKQEELYKQILGNFKMIKADSVSVLNGDVVASDFFTKEVKFHTFNTTINLNQVAIDSTYNQDRTRTLFCKEIAVSASKIILGDKKNTSEISRAAFDTRSKVLAFSSISYDAFKNGGFFKTKLEGISLQGIEWLGPVDNSDLIVDKATINKGELATLSDEQKETNSKPKKERKILTGWLRSFSLNNLEIKSINYTSRTTESKNQPFTVKNNAFTLSHIHINRTARLDESLINQVKEIELNNDLISVKSGDGLYEYRVAGIKLNTKTKKFVIKSLRVIPQLTETAFARKSHFQTSRYDITFSDIDCSSVNYEKLINREINMDNVHIASSSIKVFVDLSYPRDTIAANGQQLTYPHQLIHGFGVPVKINRLTSSKTYVEYKEKNSVSKNSGRVRFSNSYLTMNNISTYKAKAGEKMTVSFRTSFLEQVPITGGFTFFLDNWQKGTFTAEAAIASPVDATLLNELTEPMSLIKVEKGVVNSLKFSMKADTNTSNGTLVMPYKDVKISLLKKDGNDYNKKGIKSLLANIMIKNNNEEGDKMRTANVLLTRNKYRTFFNFIWMTIFKGIKDVCVLKI